MSEIKKVAARRRNGEQLPLAFTHAAAQGRDDLLVSSRMAAAVRLIDSWPNWPSPVVILVGPAGSGKSHLASVWRAASAAQDIHPLEGEGSAAAAAAGPVLFEDADRVGFDDTALFHTINSVRENGTALLITARLWPLSWPVALADLRSRLKAATIIEIGPPDEALLSQLIVKLFADRQLHIDDRIVDYIVDRMDRSFDAAMILVERMDQLALSRRMRITRALAAEVLDELSEATVED
ncbi:DnaA regulatory inactivator HdaA [Rhizobium sp. RU36D]|uniref:DnaA regulatory inactivator HdaA n=1 Tax=Rhizobium sp. RU36D TaxID=1907415 RepID=UPI0009D8DA77|nr:DnaA regulatory inactivator HdaA [Rhizobium sp. RU36D]SMD09276.1 dnaA protein [Rhizobium sp. RU36D]